jgi:Zinc carboxypeptidase
MGLEPVTKSIQKLHFFEQYLGYEELTRTLQGWAKEYPDFVRVRSLAKTEGGRDLWLIEIGRDPDRLRPAICIDANMHSAELLGTNVALAAAYTLIGLHNKQEARAKWPRTVVEAALDGLFYIFPRLSPDGAEDVVTIGRTSRSAPRQRRGHTAPAHWVRQDMDGDGKIRQLRMKHPAGEFVAHPEFGHVLVPRTVDDDGPYFKVFPEGFVADYDGVNVPFPHTLSDNDSDFNRNFPFGWSGELEGAGHFPGCEPETNAIVAFGSATPHIFSWLNLHTFGGVFIRPPFSDLAHEVAREDLNHYAYAAELAAALTGIGTISALEEMTPEPSKPMTGTLAAWAYGDRGCLSWAIELWDLFGSAGLTKRKPFYLNYAIQGREEMATLVRWDTLQNGGRTFSPWRAFRHPQLGDVEIGGIDAIHGFINPP